MTVTGDRCRFRPPDRGATVVWEVTDYCNLECLHCCTDSGPDRPRESDLTTEAMLQAAADMMAGGVSEFYISGGEPFARPDLVDVIRSIDPAAAEIYCNTNGYFIDSRVAALLAGTALRRATVSIDGHTRDIHALMRGKQSSYDRAVAAVRELLAVDVPVRISHVVHPGNVDHVADFCATMVDLGVNALVINSVFPAGRAAKFFPVLELSAGQKQRLEATVAELSASYAAQGVDIDHSIGEPAHGTAVAGCPAGRSVFYLAANGDLAACSWLYKLDPLRFRLGNLAEQRFTDLQTRVETTMAPIRALARHCPLPVVAAA